MKRESGQEEGEEGAGERVRQVQSRGGGGGGGVGSGGGGLLMLCQQGEKKGKSEKEAVNEQIVASRWIRRVQRAPGTMLTSITTVWFMRG